MTDQREVLAIGPHAWGRGKDRKEAIAICRRNLSSGTHDVLLLDVAPGTQVDGMGRTLTYPPEGKTWDDLTQEEIDALQPRKIETVKVRVRR